VLANSGFHTWKNFSEIYTQFRHVPSKKFCQPFPRQKNLENICFKACQIISLPGASGQAGTGWWIHVKTFLQVTSKGRRTEYSDQLISQACMSFLPTKKLSNNGLLVLYTTQYSGFVLILQKIQCFHLRWLTFVQVDAKVTQKEKCEITGFRYSLPEFCCLLGCYTA
jgi:hypothetical protein